MAIDTTGLITVREAACRLRRSEEQVRRNLRDGKLRGQRIGGQWFVEARALEHPERKYLIDRELLKRIYSRRSKLRELPDVVDMLRESREGR